MAAATLAIAILGGEADDDLNKILDAVKRRRSQLAERDMMLMSKDDVVRFTDDIRPRYLAGVEATITKINKTTVTLKINDPAEAGRFGGEVRCPVTLIERVAP